MLLSSWVDNKRPQARRRKYNSIMAMVLEGIFTMMASTLTLEVSLSGE
jgi:hypothetical protein